MTGVRTAADVKSGRVWKKPPFIANPWVRYGLIAIALTYLYWAFSTLPFDWQRVYEGLPRAAKIFGGAFPPSFERGSLLWTGFKESFQIAFLATLMGVGLSLPIAVMAAKNVAPLPVYLLGRTIIIISRSFHPVIVAILFVAAVGFGPLAGILTLTLYSIGFVAKLLAEEIEEIDWGQVEAMRSAGAGYFKVLIYGVFPQIMPRQIGLSIYVPARQQPARFRGGRYCRGRWYRRHADERIWALRLRFRICHFADDYWHHFDQ